jgi:hypothetical protein
MRRSLPSSSGGSERKSWGSIICVWPTTRPTSAPTTRVTTATSMGLGSRSDGPAIMAKQTTRIRIGTLVSNPVLRPPALLAKEAITIDHLSGGQLELGIGTGIEPLDHATMGIDYWSPGERVARFSEYVEVVDGLLRNPSCAYTFEGRFYRTREAAMGLRPAALTADHRRRSVTDRPAGRCRAD